MGSPRKGIKVTYCTDTRPTRSIEENAAHADLFICEGMYGEPDKQQKAREHKHMTFYEAANLAKAAEVSTDVADTLQPVPAMAGSISAAGDKDFSKCDHGKGRSDNRT